VHRLSVSSAATLTVALTDIAARQARRWGARLAAVVPPLVAPAFRPARGPLERERLRASFHLPIRLRLALVLSGSWGVGQVEETMSDIAGTGLAAPVVLCGRNYALRARVLAAGYRHVLGWVDDMAALIQACDVVVQNAGGLTAAEALASAVPVLTYRCLPGHGTTNAAALDAEGLVPWVRSPDDLVRALSCAGAGGPTVWAEPVGRAFAAAYATVLPDLARAEVPAAC
jgi:UDP-N-acetylglucosamine:LPS N-acetylglucosamine transferase